MLGSQCQWYVRPDSDMKVLGIWCTEISCLGKQKQSLTLLALVPLETQRGKPNQNIKQSNPKTTFFS